MINLELSALPNQSFSVVVNQIMYDFTIRSTNGVMSVSISRGNEVLISNVRMTAGTPLLPYKYLEEGNFLLLTNNEELPDYTQFNVSQTLVYASQAELEAIRAGT